MNHGSQITLAIESAVSGGSISLLRDGDEIANWTGASNVSKAEDLLANIDAILTKNGILRKEIDMIAVSAGPGSFTGIRIGLATALGLKAGLGIPMSSQSALKAMAARTADGETITAALPVGRNAICIQSFTKTSREVVAIDDPHAITEAELATLVQGPGSFVLHSSLYDQVSPSPNVINSGAKLALAIAHICRENAGIIVEPLFISKNF